MKDKKDIYANTQWKSIEEYFSLGKKYGVWGEKLAKIVKKAKKQIIPLPILKPPIDKKKKVNNI